MKIAEAKQKFTAAVIGVMKQERVKDAVEQIESDVADIFKRQGEMFVDRLPMLRPYFTEAAGDAEIVAVFEWIDDETYDDLQLALVEGTSAAYLGGVQTTGDMFGAYTLAFDVVSPVAIEFLEAHAAEMVTAINEETREQIAGIVTRALEDGWSYDKTASEITARFHQFAVGKPQHHIDSRAHLVAVTESAMAYEHGHRDSMASIEARGYEVQKSWEDMGDDRVSDGCMENGDAGWIPFDDAFPSGDTEPPRFPGCRCHCIYRVMEGEDEQR